MCVYVVVQSSRRPEADAEKEALTARVIAET